MANGKTHDKVTIFLSIPTCLLWQQLFSLDLRESAFFLVGFLFAGLMFGPDLDTKSVQYKRWGLFRFIWKPYQKLGGHRAFLNQSHDSFFGPLIRIVYLFLVLTIFASLVLLIIKFFGLVEISKLIGFELGTNFKRNLLGLVVGIWLGSLSHHLTDWLWEVKKFCSKSC